jgi:hypothetical protein
MPGLLQIATAHINASQASGPVVAAALVIKPEAS